MYINKKSTKYAMVVIAFAMILAACSSTNGVPDGDALYTGLKKISYENYEPCEQATTVKEEMEVSLAAAPNGALLGSSYYRWPWPYNLYIWNAYHDSESKLGKWITSSFGKAPVLLSRVNPELRSQVAQSVLKNHGYFNGRVESNIISGKNPKKAKIAYTVNMGHLWTLDSITYVGYTEEQDSLIRLSMADTRLHRGDPFDVSTLSAERERISTLFRTNGYYYYQADYSSYLADTLVVPGKAQMRLQPAENLPSEAMRKWYIGKVNVEFRKKMMERLDSVRRFRDLSIAFNGRRPPIRPRVVLANMRLRPGDLYSYENHQASVEKVNGMGIYSMVDFRFTPRDSSSTCDTLDLTLNCLFEKPYDFYVETRATGSSVGRVGPEFVVGLTKRNAFRGGEKLDISLHGAYAWQVNGGSGSSNYYEYGYDVALEFPRIVAPFFGGNRWRRHKGKRRPPRMFYSTPTTTASISNNVINRPGYFNMNTLSAEWTYTWQPTATRRFQFSPLVLQYQFKNRVSEEYKALEDSLPYISQMMQDKLVPKMRFTYAYTSPSDYRNPIAWETTISEAGNITSLTLAAFGKKWNEKDKKIYKTAYSQFLKIETDFTKIWRLDEYSTLVAHAGFGFLWTFGNSDTDVAPYSEYFYAGGANSLRAWPVRYIGPGSFGEGIDTDSKIVTFSRLGTIKGIFNLEYRPRLFGDLYGAIFIDAGNVWRRSNLVAEISTMDEDGNMNVDEENEELAYWSRGKLSMKDFFNEIALNTGIGLRYDLGFITLRLDWGLGLHVPYDNGRSGYFNARTLGRDQTIHFAVGLPF